MPQELLDIIFEEALPRKETFKPIRKSQWEDNELSQRKRLGKGYTVRPFPGPKVADFLLSKQYFFSAAKAFVGNQIINDPEIYFVTNPSLTLNIILRFVRTARVDLMWVDQVCAKLMSRATSLREMIIRLDKHDLDCFETKFPWEEEFEDDDFMTIAKQQHLEYLACVQGYSFEVKDYRFQRGPFQVDTWHLNARKFEDYVRRYVKRFQPIRSETSHSVAETPAAVSASAQAALATTSPGPQSNDISSADENVDCSTHDTTELTLARLPKTFEGIVGFLKTNTEEVANMLLKIQSEAHLQQ